MVLDSVVIAGLLYVVHDTRGEKEDDPVILSRTVLVRHSVLRPTDF